MEQLEVVVARYNEDVAWLGKLNNVVVTIYNKGAADIDAIPLPNQGREAHTYLHHIIERWDDLAPVTVFTQGNPIDHCPNFTTVVQMMADNLCDVTNKPFWNLGTWVLSIDNLTCQCWRYDWFPNVLPEVAHALFGRNFNKRIYFGAGAIFAVTKQGIQRHPLSFYQKAIEFFPHDPNNPCCRGYAHAFERLWPTIFES